ncbi:MAG: hypothetical protein KDB80_03025 [Planctomycetes bacterium]|nr:hypothetical protein [Planctomycetota bacterium]
MPRALSILGVLLLAGLARAQQDAPSTQPTLAEQALARFEDLEKEVDSIVAAWRREMTARAEQAKAAAEAGEAIPAMSMRPPLEPMIAKFAKAAAEFADTEHAPRFLVWIVRNGVGFDDAAVHAAFDTLSSKHADTPEVAGIVPMLDYLARFVGEDRIKAFVAKVKEANDDPDVLGWLAFHEYADTIEKAPIDSAEFAKAKEVLLARLEKVTDKYLRNSIRGAIDTREKFGIGNVAPDIEGIDLDGVAFKLSDYKGKVIFLDFWGDW